MTPSSSRIAARGTVIGLDFSAAEQAGKETWLAESIVVDGGLRIDACYPAWQLPDGGTTRDRCFAALRAFITAHPQVAFGLELPFGLPRRLVPDADWAAFARTFPSRYADAETFRDTCRSATGGKELKRRTDVEAETPFSTYNLRYYRKTFYGIGGVLSPLIQRDGACALPMQQPRPDLPWLLEVCPASTLKRAGRYSSYKGATFADREARAKLLAWLTGAGRVAMASPAVRRVIVDDVGGHALDSVLIAEATIRALQRPETLYPSRNAEYAMVGMVYL